MSAKKITGSCEKPTLGTDLPVNHCCPLFYLFLVNFFFSCFPDMVIKSKDYDRKRKTGPTRQDKNTPFGGEGDKKKVQDL